MRCSLPSGSHSGLLFLDFMVLYHFRHWWLYYFQLSVFAFNVSIGLQEVTHLRLWRCVTTSWAQARLLVDSQYLLLTIGCIFKLFLEVLQVWLLEELLLLMLIFLLLFNLAWNVRRHCVPVVTIDWLILLLLETWHTWSVSFGNNERILWSLCFNELLLVYWLSIAWCGCFFRHILQVQWWKFNSTTAFNSALLWELRWSIPLCGRLVTRFNVDGGVIENVKKARAAIICFVFLHLT